MFHCILWARSPVWIKASNLMNRCVSLRAQIVEESRRTGVQIPSGPLPNQFFAILSKTLSPIVFSSILSVSGSSFFNMAHKASESSSFTSQDISFFADPRCICNIALSSYTRPASGQIFSIFMNHSIFPVLELMSKVIGPATHVSGLTS